MSNFAHDLLERIHYEPVFDVQNVNPQIYSMVPILAQARVSTVWCVLINRVFTLHTILVMSFWC